MAIGFREWALVCDALDSGKQTILIRKGGIAEGRDGFSFKHAGFFLMPSYYHEQDKKVRVSVDTDVPAQPEGEVVIRLFAKVEWTREISDWQRIAAFEEFHILNEQVVKDRFEYNDTPGVSIAFLRVFRLQEPWVFADSPRYGGCRSWIDISDAPQNLQMSPVLTDAAQGSVATRLGALIG